MALIKCAECAHDVSDKASACPNCGAPVLAVLGSAGLPASASLPIAPTGDGGKGMQTVMIKKTDPTAQICLLAGIFFLVLAFICLIPLWMGAVSLFLLISIPCFVGYTAIKFVKND